MKITKITVYPSACVADDKLCGNQQ